MSWHWPYPVIPSSSSRQNSLRVDQVKDVTAHIFRFCLIGREHPSFLEPPQPIESHSWLVSSHYLRCMDWWASTETRWHKINENQARDNLENGIAFSVLWLSQESATIDTITTYSLISINKCMESPVDIPTNSDMQTRQELSAFARTLKRSLLHTDIQFNLGYNARYTSNARPSRLSATSHHHGHGSGNLVERWTPY